MSDLSTFDASSFGVLPVAAGSSDETPPTVTYTLPDGSRIQRFAAIQVSINDETGLFHAIILVVRWPLAKHTLPAEIVWSLTSGFEPFYAAASTQAKTATGYDLVLIRKDGWPTTPSFTVDAVDAGGNRAT